MVEIQVQNPVSQKRIGDLFPGECFYVPETGWIGCSVTKGQIARKSNEWSWEYWKTGGGWSSLRGWGGFEDDIVKVPAAYTILVPEAPKPRLRDVKPGQSFRFLNGRFCGEKVKRITSCPPRPIVILSRSVAYTDMDYALDDEVEILD